MSQPHSQYGKPQKISHYDIIETLGRGGMGVVYLAKDTRLERKVAIKCLHPDLFEAHFIERFKREALLLAKLNHPVQYIAPNPCLPLLRFVHDVNG